MPLASVYFLVRQLLFVLFICRMNFTQDYVFVGEDCLLWPMLAKMTMVPNFFLHLVQHLNYKINKRNLISNTSNGDCTIDVLTIEPNKGSIDPLSSLNITIEFQPMLLGVFKIEFELQVCDDITY